MCPANLLGEIVLNPDEHTITNTSYEIEGFEKLLRLISDELCCGHWLYRGVSKKEFKLIPSLGRNKFLSVEELLWKEAKMLRVAFGSEIDQSASNHSDINQLLRAQHHGAPTRLMDWTSSLLTAAYFESVPISDDIDTGFKIYAVHACPQSATDTHFNVHDLSQVCFFKGYLNGSIVKISTDDGRTSLKDELEKRGTIFLRGSDISPRVSAQQGYVSLQSNLKIPLDDQLSDNVTNCVEIVFPASARQEFQERLFQFGIRKRSLFPDDDALFTGINQEEIVREILEGKCKADELENVSVKF